MHRGISVTLPEETVRLLNRVADRGEWTAIIDLAVRRYVEHAGPADLRRRLRGEPVGAHPRHGLDTAEAWSGLDDDAWSPRDG
jgi:CopG family transcriptional regulator / antitoxin EndoAI